MSVTLKSPQLVNTPAGKLKVNMIDFDKNGKMDKCYPGAQLELVNTPAQAFFADFLLLGS